MKSKIWGVIIPFTLAACCTFLLASILQTQMVLFNLTKIQINIPFIDRLVMSWEDLVGLLPSYGVVIVIGLAIGFSIAKLFKKFVKIDNFYLNPIAGALTMLAILLAMQPILGVTLLAGARSTLGITLQMLAGFVGGYVFLILRTKITSKA